MSVKHVNEYGPSTNATPSKQALLTDAKKLDITHAFAELIDNAFQYFPLYGETDSMEITVRIQQEENSYLLIFEQNSGGVPHEHHEHLFAAGLGGGGSGPGPSISTYGRGFGIALPCLGNWIYVLTQHKEEEPMIWQLGDAEEPDEETGGDPTHPKNWYYPENREWSVPTLTSLDGNSPEELCSKGTTKIEIRKLSEKSVDELTDSNKYSKLLMELKKIYCRLIKTQQAQGEISIMFENDLMHDQALQSVDITDYLPENSVFEGDFEKIKQGTSLSWYIEESYFSFNQIFTTQERIPGTENFKQLHIDVLLVTKPGSADTARFMMWGNNRLFEYDYLPKKLTEDSLEDYYKGLDKSRPEHNKWFGFVHFHSEFTEIIPWNGPRKWGMKEDTGNEVVKFVQEILAYLGSTFTSKGINSFNMQGLENPPSNEKISWGIELFEGGDSP